MDAIEARDFSFWYGEEAGAVRRHRSPSSRAAVTALIGPSGCGKSTFLRSINRMNELIPGIRHAGAILLDDEDIYSQGHAMSSRCGSASGWCSSAGIRFPSPSTTTSPTVRASTASAPASSSTRSSRRAAPRRAVGRGEGPAARQRARTVRRPAAAALHRARAGQRARSAAARRAGQRARSDRHAEDRGACCTS